MDRATLLQNESLCKNSRVLFLNSDIKKNSTKISANATQKFQQMLLGTIKHVVQLLLEQKGVMHNGRHGKQGEGEGNCDQT